MSFGSVDVDALDEDDECGEMMAMAVTMMRMKMIASTLVNRAEVQYGDPAEHDAAVRQWLDCTNPLLMASVYLGIRRGRPAP